MFSLMKNWIFDYTDRMVHQWTLRHSSRHFGTIQLSLDGLSHLSRIRILANRRPRNISLDEPILAGAWTWLHYINHPSHIRVKREALD
jgi:hypothetical protein